jgi:Acyl-CoA carboxylase epsilon subunit
MSEQPFLRVVRGEPTAEEIAALVAALTTAHAPRAGAAPGGRSHRGSLWADRSRLVRRPLAPGPGAWRASAFPQ